MVVDSHLQLSPEMFSWTEITLCYFRCVLVNTVLLEGEPLAHSKVVNTLRKWRFSMFFCFHLSFDCGLPFRPCSWKQKLSWHDDAPPCFTGGMALLMSRARCSPHKGVWSHQTRWLYFSESFRYWHDGCFHVSSTWSIKTRLVEPWTDGCHSRTLSHLIKVTFLVLHFSHQTSSPLHASFSIWRLWRPLCSSLTCTTSDGQQWCGRHQCVSVKSLWS